MNGTAIALEGMPGRWAEWMTAMSWQVAALAVVVLALTVVFRKMPAGLRYLLWLLVFVKLVLPPYLATPWSVGNVVETARVEYWGDAGNRVDGSGRTDPMDRTDRTDVGYETYGTNGTYEGDGAIGADGVAEAGGVAGANGIAGINGAAEADDVIGAHRLGQGGATGGLREPDAVPNGALGAMGLMGGAMLVWAGIGGLLLVFLVAQYLRYSRRLLAGACAPGGILAELLPGLMKQARLKRDVRVMTSRAVQTPAVFGLWRSVVLLPEGWETRFSAEELSSVLLHELAHIRRGDVLVGWATSLLTCVYWFHPVVWFANLSMRREREMACDDAVLEATKVEGKQYASTILRVAESFDGRVPAGVGFLGLLELSDNLLHRIRSVGDSKRVRRLGWWSLMVVAVVAAVAIPMGIWTSGSEASSEAVDLTNAQAVWAKVVEVNRVWLDPKPENLSYTLNMGSAEGPPELVKRVWVSGDHGRVEISRDGQESAAKFVFDDKNTWFAADDHRGESPNGKSILPGARQGTTWSMGIQALYRSGLPGNARVTASPDDETLILEADIENTRINVGLGLIQTHYGHIQSAAQRIRLRIRTSDFVPVSEEDRSDVNGEEHVRRFEMGPAFLDVGEQKAPETLTYRGTLVDGKEWVLQAEFQVVNGVWVLREGLNLQDGKLIKRIYTTDVSTKPFDAQLVQTPSSDEREAQTGEGPVAGTDVKSAVERAVTMLSTTSEIEGDRVAQALNQVKDLPKAETLAALCAWLDNESPTLRRSAVYIIQQLPWDDPSPAYPGLRKLLEHSEDITRGMAAMALASVGDMESFDRLDTMMKEDTPYVRRCVAWAFGELGDLRGIEPLEKAQDDDNTAVRTNAAISLDRLRFLDGHKDAEGEAKDVVKGIWLIAGSTPTQYDRLDRAVALIEKASPENRKPLLEETANGDSQALANSACYAALKLGDEIEMPEASRRAVEGAMRRDTEKRFDRLRAARSDVRGKGGKRNWGTEQATGEPDTQAAGDIPTAWASKTQDEQREWLLVTFANPVVASGVKIHETFNPGAVDRIEALDSKGEEYEVWSGEDPTPSTSDKGVSEIAFKAESEVKALRIHLDSPRVKGWNEIDAVGLVDADGKVQWAISAEASSTFAEPSGVSVPSVQPAGSESFETARIMVDTEAGRDAVVRMLEASPQLSFLGAEQVSTERLVETVFLDQGEAYLVTFAPVAPFVPKDRRELLDAFNANHPRKVRSHHYRTIAAEDGSLTGFIMVDGAGAKDAVMKAYEGDAKIRVVKIEAVTVEVLKQIEPYAEELGINVYEVTFAPKPPFAPKDAEELLDAFNANHPRGVPTHHYRTALPDRKAPDAQKIEQACIMVDTEAGRNAVVRMLEASPQLSFLGAELLSADGVVKKLFLEHGEAYLVTFAPVAPFVPKDRRELLDAFNANHPKNVRSHHYGTIAAEDGSLTGFIMVDGAGAKDSVMNAYSGDGKIRVVKIEVVTLELLKQIKPYARELDVDVYDVTFAPKPPFAPKDARELLGAFNAGLPNGVRTHHYRVTTKEEAASSPISLVMIKKWPDGSWRAGIRTAALRYYKEGEAFEGYRLLRVDGEKGEVEVLLEEKKETITLKLEGKEG